jgi:hypothetical protein
VADQPYTLALAWHPHASRLAAQPGWRRTGDDDPQLDGTVSGMAAPAGYGMEFSGERRVCWSMGVTGDQPQPDTRRSDRERGSRSGSRRENGLSARGFGLSARGNAPSIVRVQDFQC